MKLSYSFRFVPALFLFILFVHSGVAAQDKWVSVRSQNFHMIGNATEKDIRAAAVQLEQFRHVFVSLFPGFKFNSPVETTVIVFRNERSFRPYKPGAWTAGYFQPGDDQNYIVLTTEGDRSQTYKTIFHEYVHYLVNNTFGKSRIPPWFNEGLAEFYAQFAISNDSRVILGNLNESHLEVMRRTKLIPFEIFFKIDNYLLGQQGGHGASVFYAQSWAFMHYLLAKPDGGDKSRQLMSFLSSALKGDNSEAAFQKAFGMTYKEAEDGLRRYVGQRRFSGTQVTFEEKLEFTGGTTVEPLTPAETAAYLGDLLYRTHRLSEAEVQLKKALEMDARSPRANMIMAMVMLRNRKFSEARQHLDIVMLAKEPSYVAYYNYAYMLSRSAMDESGWVTRYRDEDAEQMREYLEKAIKLRPDFAESYQLLTFVSIVRNDRIDEAMAHIKKALEISPGNENYLLSLASLMGRSGNHAEAERLAKTVHDGTSEPSLRNHARSILQNIERDKQYAETVAALRGGNPPPDADNRRPPLLIIEDGDEMPTEEQIAKLRAEAERFSILEALRPPQSGEQRIIGHLSKIECSRNGVLFVGRATDGPIRLHNTEFSALTLTTFIPVVDMQIGCGTVTQDLYTIMTYVPEQNSKLKSTGRLVALELIPDWLTSLEDK
ncbi:MAG: DUF1570 domain-containing protein [Blastocatellia bacterium]|nr:DUF1570 domain-containing protein [Blastocatellia bacterium]